MDQIFEKAPVLIHEQTISSGYKYGQLTLNKPDALNSLDADMAGMMLEALKQWEVQDDVLFIVIDSNGDKAFCAGGDIVSMYRLMQQNNDGYPAELEHFFALEYELDHLIRTFAKPVVVWGSGIVMGGGLGIMSGASHRVVTETSHLAMPEISIGLYPDVGGSYFLPRMKNGLGLFLGMTGATLNASDALYVGLADYVCPNNSFQQVLSALSNISELTEHTVAAHIHHILSSNKHPNPPSSVLRQHEDAISIVAQGESASQVVNQILAMNSDGNAWLEKAKSTLANGSSVTAGIVFEQIKKGAVMSLAECFRMELTLSCRSGDYGEFEEGVRAMLIDKDKKPRWKFARIDEVPQDLINWYFTPLWEGHAHPLHNLEK